jgi:hypothetical protein
MTQFASRDTPIEQPMGFGSVALPGTTVFLSSLVAIPHGANSAIIQGDQDTPFGYRMDATVGAAPADTLTASRVYLSNRSEINDIVVVDNGGAANLVVQFFTGRTGPAHRW